MRFLLIAIFFCSCNTSKVETIEKYPDGSPFITFNYPNSSDRSAFTIKVFYKNGVINKMLSVKSGMFVDNLYTYFESGKIQQIDSLENQCDTNSRACDALRTVFYENGKVAGRFNMKAGQYDGFCQNYDRNGILVKEYYVTNDTIKNGPYKEFDISGNLAFSGIFKNDTLTGFCYYFNPTGDTAKYYYNENGNISFPYKKWLKDGRILVGNYSSIEKTSVIWIWYKNGIRIKSKIFNPNKDLFVVPE